MGLGLHGGGLESTRFLAERGAVVTVTDLRDETILAPSIAKLAGLDLRYVLGRHELSDFSGADFVVKNPAVRPDSPFLAAAKRVETDISMFLAACPAPIIAVTGSKGKSSTASALHWGLERSGRRSFLGGNITVSPLGFINEVREKDTVVLELSSWQLGDLKGRRRADGRALLKPRVAVLTTILPDHLDRYGTMEAYVSDKRVIYEGQNREDATVCAADEWGRSFAAETPGRPLLCSYDDSSDSTADESAPIPVAWIALNNGPGFARLPGKVAVEIVPAVVKTPGTHQKRNLLLAAAALLDFGIDAPAIREAMGTFPGIEHRLEFFHEAGGVRYYNDTAATIPEAAAAALGAFSEPTVLVTGGTDKQLDFSPLAAAADRAKAVVLMAGTGSEKLAALLERRGVAYSGPFDSLDAAVSSAVSAAAPGDAVVLSPGCASFGMFLNEFDRGRKWKEAVARLAR